MTRFSLYLSFVCLMLFSILFSLSKGSSFIPLATLFTDHSAILLQIRLPRTLAAFANGGLLALAGSLMQLLLQNPLADPYVLGLSSGAALCTLLLMLIGAPMYGLIIGACLGSLMTSLLIFLLARQHRWQPTTLLLFGVALACGFSACIHFILLIAPMTNLHSMLFWLTGDLSEANFPYFSLGLLCIGLIICRLLAPGFNLLLRGDQSAAALGLSVKKYRMIIYALCSLFTGCAVISAGCIGFIGLIVPHLIRLRISSDHRIMLPLSAITGGALLTLADTFARTLLAPTQLPVGILLTIIGIPIFIYLLQK